MKYKDHLPAMIVLSVGLLALIVAMIYLLGFINFLCGTLPAN